MCSLSSPPRSPRGSSITSLLHETHSMRLDLHVWRLTGRDRLPRSSASSAVGRSRARTAASVARRFGRRRGGSRPWRSASARPEFPRNSGPGIKTLFAHQVESLEVTDIDFTPRFEIGWRRLATRTSAGTVPRPPIMSLTWRTASGRRCRHRAADYELFGTTWPLNPLVVFTAGDQGKVGGAARVVVAVAPPVAAAAQGAGRPARREAGFGWRGR